MASEFERVDVPVPEGLVVEVFSELPAEIVQRRWDSVNVIIRLSMLSGLQIHLEACLNMLADFAAEIAPCDSSLVYFWDEVTDQPRIRASRGLTHIPEILERGNVLNVWAARFNRPLLLHGNNGTPANVLMTATNAKSALILPLFISNRVTGCIQLFRSREDAFSVEDAQLLWVLSLVAEALLTRDYANEGLIRLAFTDYLTGLKTRGYFEQQLELEIKRSERKKNRFALLMIDIDFFKSLNDNYGHHAGDQVLRDVSSILMKDMREVDTVARYGGEEFVIVLPETGGSGAKLVAERLRRAVANAKFFAGSPTAVERLTISIGVAIFGEDANTRRELIESADAALYEAKSQGRNRVILYSELNKSAGRQAG